MERVYCLTDLGNGYFIPTMIDGKNIYHYAVAIWTLNKAQEYIDEMKSDWEVERDFYTEDWHFVV